MAIGANVVVLSDFSSADIAHFSNTENRKCRCIVYASSNRKKL